MGNVLDGKYQLLSKLGEGGMGTVYRARRVHIGDEVAVKVLHTRYIAQQEAIERFRREARAAAQLRHANVVVIYDYGEARESGVLGYIVMELVEGKSLGDILETEGKILPTRTAAIMRQICAGVGAAHKRNIIHRDLKPDNIVVLPAEGIDGVESIKVVDFGLAKLRDMLGGDTITKTGTIMGTPYYMSPEQCRGESLDPRSDVYSLGAILYEMLGGHRPFTAPSAAAVIVKHLTEEPPILANESSLPQPLVQTYKRALAKKPEHRHSDATALGREITEFLSRSSAPLIDSPIPDLTKPVVLAATPKSTAPSPVIPTLTHVGAPVQQKPLSSQPEAKNGRGRTAAIAISVLIFISIAGTALYFAFTRLKNSSPSSNDNNQATSSTHEGSGPVGGAMATGSSPVMNTKIQQNILGRWRNRTGKLQIEFKEAPTGIEGIVLRVPDVWPKDRVKVGDSIFVKGKIVGDVIEGLYINLPQGSDCDNLETRYSRCIIAFDNKTTLRVTNSAFKYSFPVCTWSTVTYDDTWNWFRF